MSAQRKLWRTELERNLRLAIRSKTVEVGEMSKLPMFTSVSLMLMLFPIAATAQQLRLGWSAVSALKAPFWVMKDAGFLAQEKVDADLIYIPSSSTMAQAQVA